MKRHYEIKKELAVCMANLMLLQNLRQKVVTYAQRETKLWNRVTDINALEIRKLILEDEKVANRKLYIRRIKLANELNLSEKSKPVRRVWIPKPGKTEKRPLGIPTTPIQE